MLLCDAAWKQYISSLPGGTVLLQFTKLLDEESQFGELRCTVSSCLLFERTCDERGIDEIGERCAMRPNHRARPHPSKSPFSTPRLRSEIMVAVLTHVTRRSLFICHFVQYRIRTVETSTPLPRLVAGPAEGHVSDMRCCRSAAWHAWRVTRPVLSKCDRVLAQC